MKPMTDYRSAGEQMLDEARVEISALTAENARLRGEVERLTKARCPGYGEHTEACETLCGSRGDCWYLGRGTSHMPVDISALTADLSRVTQDAAAECGRLRAELKDAGYAIHRLEAARRQLDGEKERIIDAIEAQYAALLAAARRIRRIGTGNVWHWSADHDDIAAFDDAIAACAPLAPDTQKE
jgi:hypothetical protein